MSAISQGFAPTKASSFRATTIGTICDEFGGEVQTGPFGSQLHASDYNEDGVPVVMPQDMVNGRIVCDRIARVSERHVIALGRHKLLPGDLVFSRRGDVTRFALVTARESGWLCGTGSIRIRMNSPEVLPEYAKRYLQQASVGQWLLHEAKGITMPNLNTKIIRALPFVTPPIKEQRRIAAILDQAEALRTQRRTALALLDNLTQSLFLDMFGDPVANPKGWKKTPFGNVCPTRLGKMLDAKQQTGQNTRRYLRNANVQWFHIDVTDLLEMDFDADARETFRLQAGDLLICEGGEPGRAAIWNGELEDVYYQKALHRGRPNPALAKAEFLVWLLWFLAKRGGLGDHVTAATIAHLTGEKLKAMEIPLPPLPLQQTFATRIASIEALKATHRRALAALDALFASLQQRAFAGQL